MFINQGEVNKVHNNHETKKVKVITPNCESVAFSDPQTEGLFRLCIVRLCFLSFYYIFHQLLRFCSSAMRNAWSQITSRPSLIKGITTPIHFHIMFILLFSMVSIRSDDYLDISTIGSPNAIGHSQKVCLYNDLVITPRLNDQLTMAECFIKEISGERSIIGCSA